jgi:HD-like signal output (HDOD) protein
MTERLPGSENRHPGLTSTAVLDSELSADTVEIPVRLSNLPPLNAIANRVLALSANPNANLKQMAVVMECDPAFAADVLFVANSSLFGFASRIQVLRHALAVLGLERIKALAVTVAMRSFIGGGGTVLRQCWQHSAACAMVAEVISPIFAITGDAAYTLGILHDIGRLGLLKSYPAEYAPVFSSAFENVEQVLSAERALLHVDHGLAGAWLVKNWAFPAIFGQACEHHHEPLDANDPELLQVVKVSCRVAEAIGFPAVNYTNASGYDEVIQSLPTHIPHGRFPAAAELRDHIETRLKSFE